MPLRRNAIGHACNARAGPQCRDLTGREPVARINTVVDGPTAAALTRLAAHHGLTKRAVLEALIADAERQALASTEDTDTYLAVTP